MYMYSAQNASSDNACMVSALLVASRLKTHVYTADFRGLSFHACSNFNIQKRERGRLEISIPSSHTRLVTCLKLDLGFTLAGEPLLERHPGLTLTGLRSVSTLSGHAFAREKE
ncbi:hypothetical protein CVIRNUC_000895 [Coccomyxa viridis]|uniref:Uncharacterized protein n=1 Tax=Coccomyxa viridis TaxID=1274662 RepID=A0AAV1HS43_9CHLO|nr:hypothetical protein CVIRNUC_000895 [Coccomyxa viridis]